MLRAARPAEDCAVRHEQGRAPAGYRFPETSWGIVLATRAQADAGRALEVLCRRYWPPVYASLRRKGFEPATAEDLTQGFFLHLIEHGIVARADPRRGRFRSFLFGALRWFLANDRERARALKRGGDSVFVPIDIAETEASMHFDARSQVPFELQFDQQWARIVVKNALDALGTEYARQGMTFEYETLRPCLDPGAESPSYATLAEHLDRNEGAIKVAVHRLRRRFRDALRGEIGCTVATAADIEDELIHLRNVLAVSPTIEPT
jgi:RNA polymerase sigma-70 factor (ECF subfamily)